MAKTEHWIDVARRVVENRTAEIHEGTLLDMWTASAMVAVYDGLSPEPRAVYHDYGFISAAAMAARLAGRKSRVTS